MVDKSKFNDRREWRKFGFSVGIIFFVLATLQFVLGKDLWLYLYGTGTFFCLMATLLPIALKPIFIALTYLGSMMGWCMTRVILTILFFMVITPIGLLAKLFNKQFLELRASPSEMSYWTDRKSRSSAKDYENQF